MKNTARLRLSLVAWVCFSIVFAHHVALSLAATPTSRVISSNEELLILDKRINAIYTDLFQLDSYPTVGTSVQRIDGIRTLTIPERETVKEIVNSCDKVRLNLGHAMDVLFLYDKISLAPDRARARKEVLAILKERITSLDYEFDRMNKATAGTDRLDIVNAATSLRSTIQQIIDVLNAVKL
jgi:hypothetical protein